MPRRCWLILDCNFLAWRAFHTARGLSYGGFGTGVVYGFFRDVLTLEKEHGTSDLVFCWDSGKKGLRHKILPTYKEKRHSKELTPEELETITDMRRQMNDIRDVYLPYLGYENNYFTKGYEADDIIASIVWNLPARDEAVIVSADKDLLQCLRPNVCIWNPTQKKVVTDKSFREQYGVAPEKWAQVKAIAGCSTDQVRGIKGIGEKTALAYFKEEVKQNKALVIDEFMATDHYFTNLKLVRLPFKDCPDYKLVDQSVSQKRWKKLCANLGMNSIMERPPGMLHGFGIKPVTVKRA
jgi:5'-3' exonuclease